MAGDCCSTFCLWEIKLDTKSSCLSHSNVNVTTWSPTQLTGEKIQVKNREWVKRKKMLVNGWSYGGTLGWELSPWLSAIELSQPAWQRWCMPLIPALERQRQADFWLRAESKGDSTSQGTYRRVKRKTKNGNLTGLLLYFQAGIVNGWSYGGTLGWELSPWLSAIELQTK